MSKLSPFLPRFWTEEPTQIRVYPCPACHETISVEAASCRFCQLPIDPKLAAQLLAENHRVTNAIAYANTFALSTYAAMLIVGYMLFDLYISDGSAKSIGGWPLIALAYGVYWLYRNRSLVTPDTDYPAAIARVKRTMMVWVAVLALQLGIYLFV